MPQLGQSAQPPSLSPHPRCRDHRLTGHLHHLHQRSSRVTGCAQAGHCRVATGREPLDVARRGARGAFAAADGSISLRMGGRDAPGSRIWQWGQCSGPVSSVRRHRGHVMVGTLQRTTCPERLLNQLGWVANRSRIAKRLAGSTGLEPAASGVTGRRSNQLNYDPKLVDFLLVGGEGFEPPTAGV